MPPEKTKPNSNSFHRPPRIHFPLQHCHRPPTIAVNQRSSTWRRSKSEGKFRCCILATCDNGFSFSFNYPGTSCMVYLPFTYIYHKKSTKRNVGIDKRYMDPMSYGLSCHCPCMSLYHFKSFGKSTITHIVLWLLERLLATKAT